MTVFEIQIIALILVAFVVGVGIGYLLRTRVFPVNSGSGESGGLTLKSRQEHQSHSLLRRGARASKSRGSARSESGHDSKGAAKKAAPAKPQKRETAKAQPNKTAEKSTANGEPDNLQEIKGIGAVLEKKLNELGIERFDQIAAWTESDIAEINDTLNFRGRIEREGWVEQARELAQRSRGGR
ncbi:MAG: hypothetical protein ACLFPA_01065 [Dichotomicrobium sp.]